MRHSRAAFLWLVWLGLSLLSSRGFGAYAAPAAPTQPTLALDELMTRVQARYDRTRHLQASFRQETRLPGFDQAQRGEGRVWILKPGMMRWEYTTPEPQIIIANGETLWIYLPQDRQAIREPLNHTLSGRTPALFLAGQARLADLFTIVGGMGQDSSEGGLLPLELLPKAGDMPYTRVQLGVDPKTYLVSRVRLTDALGYTTTMWFSDIDTEGPVDPALFHFQVPPGVDVMSSPMFPVPK